MSTAITKLKAMVEGTTARYTFQLTETDTDGVTANLDGTGLTVNAVLIAGRDGLQVPTANKVGWLTQASGTVYLDPVSTDFSAQKSPYTVRVEIMDGNSKTRCYPDQVRAELDVLPRLG
jgi:hypothetical protein